MPSRPSTCASVLRRALRHTVLDEVAVTIGPGVDSEDALLAARSASWVMHCPLTFALPARSEATASPMEVQEAPRLQDPIMRFFRAAEDDEALRE